MPYAWNDIAQAISGFSMDAGEKQQLTDFVAKQLQQVGEVQVTPTDAAVATTVATAAPTVVTNLPIPPAAKRTTLEVIKDLTTFVIKHEGTPVTLVAAGAVTACAVMTGLGITVPEWLVVICAAGVGATPVSIAKGTSHATQSQ